MRLNEGKSLFFSAIFALLSVTATAADAPNAPQERIWNLNNADIRTLIQQVSTETGKNFVIDPRVQAKVSMVSARPLSPDELYQTFLALLQLHGYSAVEEGKVVKIIPIADARFSSTKFIKPGQNNLGEEFITKVLHVDSISGHELEATLKSMVSRNAYVSVYGPTNDIIIADSADNVARIEKMIRQIDRPAQSGTQIIRLKYASAAEVARTLQDLEGNKNEYKANPVTLAVDERTNSLLISGGESRRLQLNSLVARLDVRSHNNNNTQVIYLKYIRAQDIAPIIASLIENYVAQNITEAQSMQGGTAGGAGRGNEINRQQPNFNAGNSSLMRSRPTDSSGGGSSGMGGSSSMSGGSSGSSGSSLSSHFDQNKNFTLPNDNRQRSGSASGAVQWEETTNSIIVKAPPALMRTVYSIISKLDIRRPQVLVEAVIAEVSIDRAQELGVEWESGGTQPFSTRFNSISGLSTIGGALQTGTVTVGEGLTVGFFKGTNIRALVRALAGDSTNNILATPNIVTLDNEVATIKVGQLVPFAIAQTNNQNTGGNPLTSYDREEVGLSLTIRPQITNSGAIRMSIEHILSSLVAGSSASNPGGNPTTTERVISTNVLVDHTHILVLGGLIQKQWSDTVDKIPVIGDLPLIGELFRSRHKELVKTNLMIFLKPVILRDADESFAISNEKYSSIRAQQLDTDRESDRPFRNQTPVADNIDAPKLLPPPFPISGAPMK